MAQSYKTGTVTVAAGSTSVVGTGTAWSLALVTGGLFCCAGMAVPCTVIDDTHLELDYPWPGANGADLAYSIFRETAQAASAVEANDRLASIADRLNKLSYINFDAMGTLAQRAAYDTAAKDFIYLDVTADPFKLYIKKSAAAGDWAGPNIYGRGEPGVGAGGMGMPSPGAADKLAYYTGTNALALTDLTPFARTLLDDVDAATAQETLGGTAVGKSLFTAADANAARTTLTAARDTAATSTDTADWNTITTPGFHPNVLGTTNANAPVSGQFFYCEVKRYTTDQNLIQIAYPYRNTGGGLWYRIRGTGTWGQWSQIGSDATGLLLSVGGAQAFDTAQRAQGRANLGLPAMSAIRQVVTALDNNTYATTTATAYAGNGGFISVAPSSPTSSLIVLCTAYVEATSPSTSGARIAVGMKHYDGAAYVRTGASIGSVSGFDAPGLGTGTNRFRLAVSAMSYLTPAERRSDTNVWLARLGFSPNLGDNASNYSTQFICIEVDTVS
ncbi:hypothetical protein C7441_114134 [Pseudaminobacter salicylatoxidans]|uniref:Uncharacterized protein n=1 Tax=Pseudaminobacter salicylatoxidans TaxID=93369 RepID=A0A316BZ57_PSESE|nr:pyocin knob domain-containing protein [Pseudaminobacter salicylatoxidans]PWJ79856.1 hypothetical protein C7441_114134 [Pseudaminobacter salicylatoxidans]